MDLMMASDRWPGRQGAVGGLGETGVPRGDPRYVTASRTDFIETLCIIHSCRCKGCWKNRSGGHSHKAPIMTLEESEAETIEFVANPNPANGSVVIPKEGRREFACSYPACFPSRSILLLYLQSFGSHSDFRAERKDLSCRSSWFYFRSRGCISRGFRRA